MKHKEQGMPVHKELFLLLPKPSRRSSGCVESPRHPVAASTLGSSGRKRV